MDLSPKRNRNRNRKQKKKKKKKKKKKGKRFITLEEWEQQKLEEQRQIFKPRNWLDLPSDLMLMILMKLSVVDIITTAQQVCSSWRQICKDDPLMWKSIHMNNYNTHYNALGKFARIAIDRSCGQLVDVSFEYFASDGFLEYIADRSPQLTRLRLVRCSVLNWRFSEALLKLPRLTYIDLSLSSIYKSEIEDIGRCCPLLQSFIYNKVAHRNIDNFGDEIFFEREDDYFDEEAFARVANAPGIRYCDEEASAIAASMPGIHHLMLVGRELTNVGLRAILDGCSHLASLDLRCCPYINLAGDLGKRCRYQIKEVRGPRDSMSDYHYMAYEKRRCSCCGDDSDNAHEPTYYDTILDEDEYLSDKYL